MIAFRQFVSRSLVAATVLAALAGCADKGKPDRSGGSDSFIQRTVSEQWSKEHPNATMAPNITVSQGVVSLTGTLSSPQDRIDAVRDAWQPIGVAEVVNELKIADGITQTSRKDRATTIKLRAALTFDTDVISTDYSIETLNGTIYLMGVARDDAELAKVKQVAQDIAGKTGKIVSYVRVLPKAA